MDKELFEKLYVTPLRERFLDDFRMWVEHEKNGDWHYLVFDGMEEDFYIDIDPWENVDLFWNNEHFIFAKAMTRNAFTSEDTYGEIVYEALSDLEDTFKNAKLVLQIIEILDGSTFIKKVEHDTGRKTQWGYDSIYDYKIYIKSERNKGRWKFGNIEIISE